MSDISFVSFSVTSPGSIFPGVSACFAVDRRVLPIYFVLDGIMAVRTCARFVLRLVTRFAVLWDFSPIFVILNSSPTVIARCCVPFGLFMLAFFPDFRYAVLAQIGYTVPVNMVFDGCVTT